MSWQQSVERIELYLSTAMYVLMVGAILAPLMYVVTGLFGAWRRDLMRGMTSRPLTSHEDAWREAGKRVAAGDEDDDEEDPEIDPGFKNGHG
ncbi:hypothetical protein [Mucisphaera calidilacus]|uniref:Uncharacterized protein n=1 Tax=Mucisphaera calidilacus TaxID=2527982 RepID=A0A518BTC7_9BACT|nr:hypothetical protein [Mucisphaera calidilacus]QDU70227.1 hypothetical protein Pan265_00490 [Mucisphaera calidilacus]